MKISCIAVVLLVATIAGTHGQAAIASEAAAASVQAETTPYSVSERGPHHRVWQKVTREDDGRGGTVLRTNVAYVELATGLHYRTAEGEWTEAKEEFELLPGKAVARRGQHKISLNYNLNSAGAIEMETPEGLMLKSHVLCLSYLDSSSGESVLLAEVKDCAGKVTGNQVIYEDAFTDFKADVRYTYTKAGFEQDIILREQPPTPEAYGLNPETTKLQVLTEFVQAPEPKKQPRAVVRQDGQVMANEDLSFGETHLGQGKAFSLGREDKEIPVGKQWLRLEGRDFLIEEVAVPDLAEELKALPAAAESAALIERQGPDAEARPATPGAGVVPGNSARHVVSTQRRLPAPKLAKANVGEMKVAQLASNKQGLVLDYVTLNGSFSGYTFRGDTTYYISGPLNVTGTCTVEGGAVLKYASGSQLIVGYPPQWLASAYRPVIFTAKDDNTVGETISGSTGNPQSYSCPLAFGYSPTTISNFRISYAQTAIKLNSGGSPVFSNGQLVNCNYGFDFGSIPYLNVTIRNMLFANVYCSFYGIYYSSVDAQNATFRVNYLVGSPGYYANLSLKNCILANVASLGITPTGTTNGFYNCPQFGTGAITNTLNPFQTVGGGSYYLASGCAFLNAGTPNINPALLADLRKKTTYPPEVRSGTVSINTELSMRAQRDTDQPDLGYHYDPVDYITDQYNVMNAALIVTNGAAIACYNRTGIQLWDGSSITSIGTPVNPNWFVRYQSVQEQAISLPGGSSPGSSTPITPSHNGSVWPNGTFRFSRFATPAGGSLQLYHEGNNSYNNLVLQDCEVWNGTNQLSGAAGTAVLAKNNLFHRSAVIAASTYSQPTLALSNNLVFGGYVALSQPAGCVWNAFNNCFDSCTIAGSTLTNGYNGYIGSSGRLLPNYGHDVVTTMTYVSGPLGNFYHNLNNLTNKGSVTADVAGLYHYTVRTNLVNGMQIKETNSVVDIGYHYVAVDANGLPLDYDGDTIPDYLEDADGDGLSDAAETDWQSYNSPNGLTGGNGLLVFPPFK